MKIKTYKRWPKDRDILQKRLEKICSQIHRFLSRDFPRVVLLDGYSQEEYKIIFTKIWKSLGYHWDLHPQINIEITGGIDCPSVVITFLIKHRDGTLMHC